MPLTILPVLDLLSGQVVRGVAGRRHEYRPLQSAIADSAAPGAVAGAYVERFGFREAYVADLDAIAGREPSWEGYRAIADAGVSIWLDAGVGDRTAAGRLLDFFRNGDALARLIVGLESLPRPELLGELVELCGPKRLVFSLDLKLGQPLTAAEAWRGLSPDEIAEAAVECGIETMILLDLAQVGVYQGAGTEELCRRLRGRYPQLGLIGGGGVRSIADLPPLAEAGFDMVLVASALHDGRITPEDLQHA